MPEVVVYSSLRFDLYEPISKVVVGATGRDTPLYKNIVADLSSGIVAVALASPTDSLTIRMMTDAS